MQGLLGGIGAAVAAAKVMALDEDGITTAIGLAANQASGGSATDQGITDKTHGQLRTAYPDAAAERIFAQSWAIEECPRVDAFCKELAAVAWTLLTPRRAASPVRPPARRT